jgi:hypothetical protein
MSTSTGRVLIINNHKYINLDIYPSLLRDWGGLKGMEDNC